MIERIDGFEIKINKDSSRIIDVDIENEILNKLIFPFNKFDITALEYKPFTRFTIAKSLDDLSDNKLSKLLNSIIRDRKTGCFIIKPKNLTPKIDDVFFKQQRIHFSNNKIEENKLYVIKHNKDNSTKYLVIEEINWLKTQIY